MKKVYLSALFVFLSISVIAGNYAYAETCRTNDGVICLERRLCQPASDALEQAARDCRSGGPSMLNL